MFGASVGVLIRALIKFAICSQAPENECYFLNVYRKVLASHQMLIRI